MRVGIYLGYPFPVLLAGEGIGRYVVRLAAGLLYEEPGTEIHILVMPPNVTEVEQMFTRLKLEFPSRLTIYCSDDLRWINTGVPVDLWIVPWVGLESAQYLTKPLLVCLHDLAWLHVPELEDLGKWIDGTAKTLTRKAAAVICNSSYIRTCDGLDYLKLSPEKTHVIRPAAPAEEYSSFALCQEQEFREQYRLNHNYFVFPSIIRPHKNHLRLIKAFFRFKQEQTTRKTELDLVFTDYWENFYHKSELLRGCDPLFDSIKFLGRLPAHALPALYKYAAGTVVPTLFEGSCPFPILESLLMGTPVSFGRIAVAMEVIRDRGAFITFDPYDVADIQRAIGELWESGKSTAVKQKTALSYVLARTWRDVAREYHTVFDRIMG
ncbi:glycosyl transferases group 1 [Lucifera butyrica]|uniref:Glycosyl transferases group 1 n=1 Tax=Lucifera butyrica TaxID=1351585 RepID=A0A498REK5_9FIRM|nr:glycosyltransferase [Lucifera butyrica]VBB08532.1 glycosyl transferases group 1 [Lucifera butyrica]